MLKKLINKILNNQPNIISFKQGFDLTELPVITLTQNSKKFNFLLDTGSNDSIINSKVLKDLEYETADKKSNLFGLEGNAQEVSICKMTFSYMDKGYTYDYLICDMSNAFENIKKETGVTLHGILGSKFFNEFKYVLDFDELIAYSKK